MDEKNRERSVMEDDLPDTAAFEIMDVLPEEEAENVKEEKTSAPGKGNRIWIIAAALVLVAALIWLITR